MEYQGLSRTVWGRHMWAPGYFAASSGNATDEVSTYIEWYKKLHPHCDLKVNDELEPAGIESQCDLPKAIIV